MATTRRSSRKKKPVKVKFEMTRGAIFGVAIVCFCLFLWMFLLGIWTGQSVLAPYTGAGNNGLESKITKRSKQTNKPMIKTKQDDSPPFIRAVDKKKVNKK